MPKALEKQCQMCKQVKPLSEFFHNRTKPDFHNGICKECQKKVNEKNRGG
jgi:hypothetical protein